MVFSDRTYSVLVVSSAEKMNQALAALLPDTDYHPVRFVTSAAAARRELSARAYDFVIINSPLSDDFGLKLAMDLCANKYCVPLLLVRSDSYAEVKDKATHHGVFTLQKPTSSQIISQGLSWMAAARERLRSMEQKSATVEEKMEEIRLVNRAKWLLIENLKMTEADAHHYIEKQAMDRCASRREIANQIIRTYQ